MEPEKEEQLLNSVSRIERGIYGDPENKVEGMIDKVNKHDGIYSKIAFFIDRPKLIIWFGILFLYLAIYLSHKGIDSIIEILTK
jgi:hypothetical protein